MFRTILLASVVLALAACSSHSANGGAANPTPGNAPANAGGGAPMTGEANSTFATEAAAQSHCPSDVVVWENTTSHVYHTKGTTFYGHTKHGGYGCEKEADASGFHEAGHSSKASTK